MQDDLRVMGMGSKHLRKPDEQWLEKMEELGEERGYFEPLGAHHSAILTDEGATLVVTFETINEIKSAGGDQTPVGWEIVRDTNWSHLCILAHQDSWFRDRSVYGYFDRLIEDGFFEEFERVIFYGAGMCGYAAAAFSVVAPDVTVIAVNPQTTLDPNRAAWDRRFPHMRRTSFADRYGYAPDMVELAEDVFVLYSFDEPEDVMHASLFQGENVHHIACRWLGEYPGRLLWDMGATREMIELAADGLLDETSCYQAMRARRESRPYLRNLVTRLETEGRMHLVKAVAANVLSRTNNAPHFKKSLARAEQALSQ